MTKFDIIDNQFVNASDDLIVLLNLKDTIINNNLIINGGIGNLINPKDEIYLDTSNKRLCFNVLDSNTNMYKIITLVTTEVWGSKDDENFKLNLKYDMALSVYRQLGCFVGEDDEFDIKIIYSNKYKTIIGYIDDNDDEYKEVLLHTYELVDYLTIDGIRVKDAYKLNFIYS